MATLQVSKQGFERMYDFFEKSLREGTPKELIQQSWEANMHAAGCRQPEMPGDGDSEGEAHDPKDAGSLGDLELKRKQVKCAEYQRKAEAAQKKVWRQQRANAAAKQKADTLGLRDMGQSHVDEPMEETVGSPPMSPFRPADSGEDF